ncbi:hypothetical protein M419DRAFT_10706 [Trichoderma reesei RUT C-30]|uniref:Integrase zinc-binding domain-containing protein n=1 Tax=Hypocrea jecorina (strain ATCC 56765 / BCRC 32924 / NRRL 11460 / Rut C-30) TaxID=1344414 RepID=A0A024S5L3_HYPJR|nr:hypothetical protein M419DRAFT_10706 [Trichoderma reesei RUT C-30]
MGSWSKNKSELHPYFPFSKCPLVQAQFAEYLKSTPNKKHISREEKWKLVAWLADPNARPTCQKDYSRRNYAQKTYRWDENTQKLFAIPKKDKTGDRIVITEDEILRVVESVHTVDHGGWDATWESVSKKYCGIVRSDIIFLVKRCGMCIIDPRKRAKGVQAESPGSAEASASPEASATAASVASAFASAPALNPDPLLPMMPLAFSIDFRDFLPEEYPYDEYPYVDNDGQNEGNDAIALWQAPSWQQEEWQQEEWLQDIMAIDPSLLDITYGILMGEPSGSSSNNNAYPGYYLQQ